MHRIFFQNLLPGTLLFGCFRVLSCLSANEIGGVYLCEVFRNPRRKLVVKVLYTPALHDLTQKERMRREFEVTCNLFHPNVVHSDHFFQDDVFTAFTMEYVQGGTLADFIDRQQPISIDHTIRILLQICAGIEAIHEVGLVHRDLKPENILIGKRLSIKIGDFGLAEESSKPNVLPLVGTPHYLSPEYIGHGVFDYRSDLYAIGVIAYELLTGRFPFTHHSVVEELTQMLNTDPITPMCLNPKCPAELSAIVMRALKRRPPERQSSAKQLRQELLYVLAHYQSSESSTQMPAYIEVTKVESSQSKPGILRMLNQNQA